MPRTVWLFGAVGVLALAGCADVLGIREGDLLPNGGAGGSGGDGGGGDGGGGGSAGRGGSAGDGGQGGLFGGCAYATMVRADGAAAYWRLDDAGDATVDSVGSLDGNRVDVTQPRPSLVPNCPDDDAVQFATANALIDFGDVLDFAGQQPFTVEAWIDIDGETPAGSIISKLDQMDGWSLGYNLQGSAEFRRVIEGVNGPDAELPLAIGTHHLVGRFDPDNANICLFVDAMATCQRSNGNLPDKTTPLRFSDSMFDGTLDDVAVYPVALQNAVITAHFELGKSPP